MTGRRRSKGADAEASRVTRGLDVLPPSKSAAPSWRLDATASASHSARHRSQSRRVLPSCAQTAWHQVPPRGWAWATKHASLISMANTTDRGGAPGPEGGSKCAP
jgi:hypothetical protein